MLCAPTAASSALPSSSSDPFNESPPSLGDRFEAYSRSGTPLRLILFIVLLSTPSITQQLASFFTCEEVAGRAYMERDLGEECYEGLWVRLAAPVSLLLCLYAVGVPVALFVLLYRYRERLDVRFLHSAYKDEYYWWDCTEQLRKLLLLLCNAVLAPRAPAFYGPTSLSLSFVALSVHLSLQPYKAMRDLWFQTADLAGVCLFFMWNVTLPNEDASDVVAWIYWLYAVCYTLASIIALLSPLCVRAIECWKNSKCGGGRGKSDDSSELHALVPRSRGKK